VRSIHDNENAPKLVAAAYTHLVLLASKLIPSVTLGELVSETRKTYNGPLEVGEDLMSFEITDKIMGRRFAR